jgi:hypothetical protein
MSTVVDSEWVHLDSLIERLKSSSGGELVVEHLQTAHALLHGAMPAECEHNLQLADSAVSALSDRALKVEVKKAIAGVLRAQGLLAQNRIPTSPKSAATNPPHITAKGVTEFFHGSDVSFGIFYPKKHVVAVFSSFDLAQRGYQVLSDAGYRMWEIIAVSGEEVGRFLEEIRMNRTLWHELVKEVSVFLDTEANLVDRYAYWARHEYGFLVAHSDNSDAAERVAALLDPLNPVAMHWFMNSYIQHLTQGN